MAKIEVKMPEEFLLKISTLAEKTDEIAPKVLQAGGEIVLDRVKRNLQSVVGKGTKYESRSTGTLISSLGLTGTKMDRNANYNVKVGFSKSRSDGESNAKLASIIEYGKHGQAPKTIHEASENIKQKRMYRSNEIKVRG